MMQTGKGTVSRHSTRTWIHIISPRNHADVHIIQMSVAEVAQSDFRKKEDKATFILFLSLSCFVLHQQ